MTERADPRARREAVRGDPLARYERMVEIRRLEDRVLELFREGRVAGSTHTCQGQEAVSVGIASALRSDDWVTCTYRGHGMALALGVPPAEVLGEILGRRTGSMGGLGGSMHLSEPSVGLLPTFAIVGAGIPVAAGAALTAQVQGTGQVAVAVFGDGATNIGAFHEGLNLAAIWRLPVVFVIENNLYGEYSRIDWTTPVEDLAVRAISYAMPSVIVDGQDLEAVREAVEEAAGRARAREGPTLLEVKTYRFVGHSRGDAATYRRKGELEAWEERDPIDLYRAHLEEDGLADRDRLSGIEEEVAVRLEEVVAEVLEAPAPDERYMFRHVFAKP